MALLNLKLWWIVPVMALLIACEDADDFNNVIEQISCTDGIQNGDETGVDCGGSCTPCIDGLDFSGVYIQQDVAGRPGINTVFNLNGPLQDVFNTTEVSMRSSQDTIIGTSDLTFPQIFKDNIDLYFVGYPLNEAPTSFQTNVLGLNAQEFAAFLATSDALQLTADGPTSYRITDQWFTGRNLTDDTMDTTLLLLFGGPEGDRFDGVNGPLLISDDVGIGDRVFQTQFPYLEAPLGL